MFAFPFHLVSGSVLGWSRPWVLLTKSCLAQRCSVGNQNTTCGPSTSGRWSAAPYQGNAVSWEQGVTCRNFCERSLENAVFDRTRAAVLWDAGALLHVGFVLVNKEAKPSKEFKVLPHKATRGRAVTAVYQLQECWFLVTRDSYCCNSRCCRKNK